MPDTLKKGWRSWRFDQMAYMVNDRIDDPSEANVEHYVGLEHLDSDSLTIRRWGSPSDVEATKLCFCKGDIIFGRRRVYQRKLAVAPFDGICSAHAMVLRPKTDVALPEFLPFFMQSDLFMERAKQISVGSLSPTINWKTLAAEEFALPPLDEQRRIAEVLGAGTEATDALCYASRAAERTFTAALRGMMANPTWSAVPLGELARVDRGKFSHRPRNLPEFFGGPYPFVQTGDVAAARGRILKPSQTLSDEGVQYSKSFPGNSILITIAAVIGATAITTSETWCTDSVVGIVPADRDSVDFLEYALRFLRPYLEFEAATQTAQKNINLDVLRPLLIPWPEKNTRSDVGRLLSMMESAVSSLSSRAAHTQHITKMMASQLTEGTT
jgi:type I restriction enzyme, S subunit